MYAIRRPKALARVMVFSDEERTVSSIENLHDSSHAFWHLIQVYAVKYSHPGSQKMSERLTPSLNKKINFFLVTLQFYVQDAARAQAKSTLICDKWELNEPTKENKMQWNEDMLIISAENNCRTSFLSSLFNHNAIKLSDI